MTEAEQLAQEARDYLKVEGGLFGILAKMVVDIVAIKKDLMKLKNGEK
jgi:hypothetical protein